MARASKAAQIVGWLLAVVPIGMLFFSAAMKIMKPPQVVEGMAKNGMSEKLLLPLAITEIACTVLYLIPRTSVLGAILLTGYLGGAIFSHVRTSDPMFVIPAVFGVLLWLSLYLREPRLRALAPLRG